MNSLEALKMLETRCRLYANDELEIEETYEARVVIGNDLKVLEILKKKKVDISELDFVLKSNDTDETKLMKYNRYYACEEQFYLTKQEFNQIKDWIERK